MEQIYEKHRDEDGFLYLTYQDMEDKGAYWLAMGDQASFCIAFYWETFWVTVVNDRERWINVCMMAIKKELIYAWESGDI